MTSEEYRSYVQGNLRSPDVLRNQYMLQQGNIASPRSLGHPMIDAIGSRVFPTDSYGRSLVGFAPRFNENTPTAYRMNALSNSDAYLHGSMRMSGMAATNMYNAITSPNGVWGKLTAHDPQMRRFTQQAASFLTSTDPYITSQGMALVDRALGVQNRGSGFNVVSAMSGQIASSFRGVAGSYGGTGISNKTMAQAITTSLGSSVYNMVYSNGDNGLSQNLNFTRGLSENVIQGLANNLVMSKNFQAQHGAEFQRNALLQNSATAASDKIRAGISGLEAMSTTQGDMDAVAKANTYAELNRAGSAAGEAYRNLRKSGKFDTQAAIEEGVNLASTIEGVNGRSVRKKFSELAKKYGSDHDTFVREAVDYLRTEEDVSEDALGRIQYKMQTAGLLTAFANGDGTNGGFAKEELNGDTALQRMRSANSLRKSLGLGNIQDTEGFKAGVLSRMKDLAYDDSLDSEFSEKFNMSRKKFRGVYEGFMRDVDTENMTGSEISRAFNNYVQEKTGSNKDYTTIVDELTDAGLEKWQTSGFSAKNDMINKLKGLDDTQTSMLFDALKKDSTVAASFTGSNNPEQMMQAIIQDLYAEDRETSDRMIVALENAGKKMADDAKKAGEDNKQILKDGLQAMVNVTDTFGAIFGDAESAAQFASSIQGNSSIAEMNAISARGQSVLAMSKDLGIPMAALGGYMRDFSQRNYSYFGSDQRDAANSYGGGAMSGAALFATQLGMANALRDQKGGLTSAYDTTRAMDAAGERVASFMGSTANQYLLFAKYNEGKLGSDYSTIENLLTSTNLEDRNRGVAMLNSRFGEDRVTRAVSNQSYMTMISDKVSAEWQANVAGKAVVNSDVGYRRNAKYTTARNGILETLSEANASDFLTNDENRRKLQAIQEGIGNVYGSDVEGFSDIQNLIYNTDMSDPEAVQRTLSQLEEMQGKDIYNGDKLKELFSLGEKAARDAIGDVSINPALSYADSLTALSELGVDVSGAQEMLSKRDLSGVSSFINSAKGKLTPDQLKQFNASYEKKRKRRDSGFKDEYALTLAEEFGLNATDLEAALKENGLVDENGQMIGGQDASSAFTENMGKLSAAFDKNVKNQTALDNKSQRSYLLGALASNFKPELLAENVFDFNGFMNSDRDSRAAALKKAGFEDGKINEILDGMDAAKREDASGNMQAAQYDIISGIAANIQKILDKIGIKEATQT